MIPKFHVRVYNQKEMKTSYKRDISTVIFIATLPTIDKTPSVHRRMGG